MAVAVGNSVAVGVRGIGLGDGLAMAIAIGAGCWLKGVAVSAGSTVGAGAPESEQLRGAQIKIKMMRRQISGIWLGFIIDL
jgi:hypothetical protein